MSSGTAVRAAQSVGEGGAGRGAMPGRGASAGGAARGGAGARAGTAGVPSGIVCPAMRAGGGAGGRWAGGGAMEAGRGGGGAARCGGCCVGAASGARGWSPGGAAFTGARVTCGAGADVAGWAVTWGRACAIGCRGVWDVGASSKCLGSRAGCPGATLPSGGRAAGGAAGGFANGPGIPGWVVATSVRLDGGTTFVLGWSNDGPGRLRRSRLRSRWRMSGVSVGAGSSGLFLGSLLTG